MSIATYSNEHLKFTWLDIVDPDTEELLSISEKYDLHAYTLKDCLEPDHLPKHEALENTEFLITRLLTAEKHQKADSIQEISDKLAIFYSHKYVITVHVKPLDFLQEIRATFLDNNKCKSAGQLVTRLIWEVLDSYDKSAMRLSLQVDDFETKLFLKTFDSTMLEDLYYIKRKASVCKKLLLLSGEVINNVKTDDPVALQDVRDLQVKLLNIFGQVHEDVTNLLNTYLSMSAQKTNDVMKVLTVFSVFFMPLTFIAGIYGMNFHFMPELNLKFGYPAVLLFMAVTSLAIYIWFRKKRWL
jgi:magnesium transporter